MVITRRRPHESQSHERIPTRRAAFTLVELLVTIAILTVVASIVIPNFSQPRGRVAEFRAQRHLRALCDAVAELMEDNEQPIPLSLASIIDALPDGFEVIEEADGSSVDIAADGYRFHLLLDNRLVQVMNRFGYPENVDDFERYLASRRGFREYLDFAICATPSSRLLSENEYCIKYDGRADSCLGLTRFEYGGDLDDELVDAKKARLLEGLAMQVIDRAMALQIAPEQLSVFIRTVDGPFLKNTVGQFIDENQDGQVSLQEIRDLDRFPAFQPAIDMWVDTFGIGKYGEKIDQVSTPIETLSFADNSAVFITEYHGVYGRLRLEEQTRGVRGIYGSLTAAEQAARRGDVKRELRHIESIRDKAGRAWFDQELSTDGLDFVDYALDLREVYLQEDD